jgi:hypothetical protein
MERALLMRTVEIRMSRSWSFAMVLLLAGENAALAETGARAAPEQRPGTAATPVVVTSSPTAANVEHRPDDVPSSAELRLVETATPQVAVPEEPDRDLPSTTGPVLVIAAGAVTTLFAVSALMVHAGLDGESRNSDTGGITAAAVLGPAALVAGIVWFGDVEQERLERSSAWATVKSLPTPSYEPATHTASLSLARRF